MADLPVAQADAGLNAMFAPATTYYLSLHTADPGTTGANEVTGGSYARQAITFSSASNGSQTSTNAQTFTNMPAVTLAGTGIWSTATAGNYLGGGPATSTAIPAGATVQYSAGDVSNTLS